MTLPRAVESPELLDEAAHDPRELEQSLAQVAAVNRWLGGRRALLHHLAPLLEPARTTRILDVGTGSGDLPRAIAHHARKQHRSVQITATDVHPQMVEIAKRKCRGYPEIVVQTADVLALPYVAHSFDVVTMSMTLHHFDEPEQLRILRGLGRVAKTVIVNDLRRTRLNYLGAKLLSVTLWRGNRLTRHDGPLSVLRAFTPEELVDVAKRAGLQARAFRHYFQRVVLVGHA